MDLHTTEPAVPSKPKRIYAFRLRTLFTVVSVICLGLAPISYYRHQAMKELAACKAIQKLGLFVKIEKSPLTNSGWLRTALGFHSIDNITIYQIPDYDPANNDAALTCLGGMKQLRSLTLHDWRISDEDFRHLADLSQLESFSIDGMKITGTGFAYLRSLPRLKHLQFGNTTISDAGLAHIGKLGHLEFLYLEDADISDAGLVGIGEMKTLRYLRLDKTKVTDTGLTHLQGLSQLEALALFRCNIAGPGLRHLQALPRLRALQLYRIKIPELELVDHLQGLTQLTSLFVADVSDWGSEQLEKALPKCAINPGQMRCYE